MCQIPVLLVKYNLFEQMSSLEYYISKYQLIRFIKDTLGNVKCQYHESLIEKEYRHKQWAVEFVEKLPAIFVYHQQLHDKEKKHIKSCVSIYSGTNIYDFKTMLKSEKSPYFWREFRLLITVTSEYFLHFPLNLQ